MNFPITAEVDEHMKNLTKEKRISAPLSPQEYTVLQLIPTGKTAKEMSIMFSPPLSPRTIYYHLENLYYKMGVSGLNARVEAYARGIELGLIGGVVATEVESVVM